MEFKELQFIDSDTQRVYKNYIQSIKNATKELLIEDSQEILMEFNSHIYESMQLKNSKSEINNLLKAIDKLGTPEEVLKPLIADRILNKATRSFKPNDIFYALYLNIGNGISYLIFGALYVLVGTFTLSIFLKIFYPAYTGLFIGNGTFFIGAADEATIYGLNEVLGNWFIPLMLLLNIVLYFIITIALSFKKNINIKYRKP